MKCFKCGMSASEYHHAFYGRGTRDIAEKYNIKIPACQKCHKEYHDSKIINQMKICARLKLPYNLLKFIMNKNEKRWTPYEQGVMDRIRENMQKKIDKWEEI